MNTTIAPHFWRFHWHNGSKEFHEPFDAQAIAREKKFLATGCWLHRDKHHEDSFYVSRKVWRQQCFNNPTLCQWVAWPQRHNDAVSANNASLQVKRAIDAAWYTMIPIGDYHTRGSIFDMLVSNSIGVLEHRVEISLPFLDALHYHDFVRFVEPGVPIIDELKAQFNETEAMQMIEKKFKYKHLFQYSLAPNHRLVSLQTRHEVHEDDDAFTFTLKTMLRRWCREGFYKLLKCH